MENKKETTQSDKENKKKQEIISSEEEPKIKKIIERFSMMSMQSGGLPPQILEKLTERHIDKVLEDNSKTIDYMHKDRKHKLIFNFLCFIIVTALMLVLVFWLKDSNAELLKTLITILISAGGGFGVGWGIAKNTE